MTKFAYTLALLSAMLVSCYSAPAYARARVFVASYGDDANPCTFGSPCKTFQHAVDVVDAGGEVTAIDSAGFGPIHINKSVTITSPDGVEAGIVPAAGGNAIVVNAGASDVVFLRGLTINGSGNSFNGIVFVSGASLTITNCVVQNFVQDGIAIAPASGGTNFVIRDTLLSHNLVGIEYIAPSGTAGIAKGVLDHVVATTNQSGFMIETDQGGGATSVVIANSVASENSLDGILITNGTNPASLTVSIDNTTSSGNGRWGILGGGTSKIRLGRSVITDNDNSAILNVTNPNTFYTYKDNRIGVICLGCSPLNTTLTLQ